MVKSDDTWKFWNIFTDNVMLPYLMFWLGIRFANWKLRVAAIKLIAPISHALDRTSYLQILPRHIADIQCLPPSILKHFKSVGFIVNVSGKPFSDVAFDESHEMPINKDIKAAIRKVKSEYIQRICPYLPTRARILKTLKSQMNLNRDVLNQSLMQISKKDQNFEQNIRKIFCIVQEAKLFPEITDKVASPQVKEDMLGFVSIGEREMDAYVKSRILNIPSTEAPVSRKRLKNFQRPAKIRIRTK